MIYVIAMKELRSLFLSPFAWTVLAVIQLIMAYLFLAQVDFFLQIQPRLVGLENAPGVTEIIVAPLYGNAAMVMLLIVPMITMRMLSDERRNQTMPLLFSAPISMTEIVLGKYVGVVMFLSLMLLMLTLMPLSLLLGGGLDLGVLLACVLGLFLLLASFAAIGLFMSSLTAQPTVAAVSTFGVLLLLWVLDWDRGAQEDSVDILGYFSIVRHYESLLQGRFNSADIVYYLLVIALFVILSIRQLDADRLQH